MDLFNASIEREREREGWVYFCFGRSVAVSSPHEEKKRKGKSFLKILGCKRNPKAMSLGIFFRVSNNHHLTHEWSSGLALGKY